MKLMNLFQIFDPSSVLGFPIMMTIIVLMALIFKTIKKSKDLKKMISFSELGNSLSGKETIKFIILFVLISMINILSLVPNSFAPTSQISLNFPLALIIWLSINFFFSIKKTKHFFEHLVPTGSPSGLVPLMVLIELTSNMIRPITLSVRLTANIVAGHLLISLLEQFLGGSSSSMILSSILLMLETGVAIIQGYVFSVLASLYYQETK